MSKLLIELQYFGTASWFVNAMRHNHVMIEAHENFEKSTYRNRCYIASPEGKLRLTIPLLHGRSQRAKYSEVKIDYSHDWQKIHWNSLCSCYRNSPYFEYYEDKLMPFFSQKHERLFDFNKELLHCMIELLDLNLKIEYTVTFEKNLTEGITDFRSKILPNNNDTPGSFPLLYHQVFRNNTGFLSDLSIADLLFNEGPLSKEWLLTAVSKD